MSNSHRNPKELRNLIQNCHNESFLDDPFMNDLECMDETFKDLRHITKEEKSELGMMKNRIDEQSRLIMVLKKSGDDYLNKNAVLETLNKQQNDQIEELEASIKKLDQNNTLISQRFKTLSDYNTEIIKFKDEYKEKNVKLNLELVALKNKLNSSDEAKKYAAMKEELENKIIALTEKCDQNDKDLEKTNLKNERIKTTLLKNHEENIQSLNLEWESKQALKDKDISELTAKLASKDNEFMKYKSEIDNNKREITSLQSKINSKEIEHDKKIKEMESLIEKNRLDFEKKSSQFSININTVTKEKLHQASQCKKLTEDNKFLSERCSCLEETIEKLEEELNESSLVDQKRRYQNLCSEFENYKVYVNVLIEKEKAVNEKLRFLVS